MSENRQGIDLSKLTAAQLRFVLAENKVSFPSKAKKADLLRLCNKLIDESDAEEVSQRIGAAIAKERVDHETKLRLRQKKMKESAKANSEPAESLPAEKVSVQKSPNKKSVAGKKHSRTESEDEDSDKNKKKRAKSTDDNIKIKNNQTAAVNSTSALATPVKAAESSSLSRNKLESKSDIPVTRGAMHDEIKKESSAKKGKKKLQEIENLVTSQTPKKLSEQVQKISQKAEEVVEEIKEDIKEELCPTKDEFVKHKEEEPSKLFAVLDEIMIYLFKFLVIVLPILFFLWYREQKIRVGFCGHELPVAKFAPYANSNKVWASVDKTLERFLPKCKLCPEGAICKTHLQMSCKDGYVLRKSWWNLESLLPLADKCITKRKAANKKTPLLFALDLLRTQNANTHCGSTLPDNYQAGMLEKDLFNNVYEEYKDMMTKESFEKEWAVLSNSLKRLPEIYYKTFVSKNVAGNIENIQLFRSLSKQNVSYFCGIFKLLKEFPIEKNVLLVALTIFSCTVTLEIILQKLWKCQNRENAFVEKSTEKALEKLREASRDPEVKFLDTVQLREFLLSETTNLKKKNQLWDKISSKLLENENVEKRQMELYGEVLGIWEWND